MRQEQPAAGSARGEVPPLERKAAEPQRPERGPGAPARRLPAVLPRQGWELRLASHLPASRQSGGAGVQRGGAAVWLPEASRVAGLHRRCSRRKLPGRDAQPSSRERLAPEAVCLLLV